MAVVHDWSHDVKKYIPSANEAAIAGIVKHLGIALQSRDASFVACEDKTERDRVRDSFLKKKLGLTDADAELEKSIVEICKKMHGDRDKSRVAFYYMLAEKYGKLSLFS
ncbi:DUF2853 family protein [Pseudorhodoplanes sinuspersici]|uniref:Uncharacterized protein n=1 Tax=Pseudorhodoplanes sinuspersici TaxID=1235591 RepID=A0A1W7A0G3_9HYPH|nr:DUF2853 family protein [Pseudorhodoplanes sinuspersici]ARQ02515.1 hypothetical protein CAK95_27920 [Pseudorhodoplanes sinuspersici]RKE74355.1 uncharacterized protein DUF2853 [Pseudorhodoplanes sinuspersici]